MRLWNLTRLAIIKNHSFNCYSLVTNVIRHSSNKQVKVNQKDLIRLYDQHDKPIGIKLKSEAEELAHKHKFDLVERNVRSQTKYKEFMLKSRIDELLDDTDGPANNNKSNLNPKINPITLTKPEDLSKKTVGFNQKQIDSKKIVYNEQKRLTFTANISDHDLEYRLQSMRSILQKKVLIRLLITGKPNGREQLENLYEKIQQRFGNEVKLKQKIFSGHNLKFTIEPTNELLTNIEQKSENRLNQINLNEVKIDEEEIEQLVENMLKDKK